MAPGLFLAPMQRREGDLSSNRHGPGGARRTAEQGAVSLEFALVLPFFLLLVLGTITFGQAFTVRHVLHAAAYRASRTCTMARAPTQPCALQVVTKHLQDASVLGWCTQLTVRADNLPQNGFIGGFAQAPGNVNALQVTATCTFGLGLGQGYLAAQQIPRIGSIQAVSVMPY